MFSWLILDRRCDGLGKQRWIPLHKELFCRNHKLFDGIDELSKALHHHAVACCSDNAGMSFNEISRGDASCMNDKMADILDQLQP